MKHSFQKATLSWLVVIKFIPLMSCFSGRRLSFFEVCFISHLPVDDLNIQLLPLYVLVFAKTGSFSIFVQQGNQLM